MHRDRVSRICSDRLRTADLLRLCKVVIKIDSSKAAQPIDKIWQVSCPPSAWCVEKQSHPKDPKIRKNCVSILTAQLQWARNMMGSTILFSMCCRSWYTNSNNNGTKMCSSPCVVSNDDTGVIDSDVVVTVCLQTALMMLQILEDIVLCHCNVWTIVVTLVVSLSVSRMCLRVRARADRGRVSIHWRYVGVKDLFRVRRCKQDETSEYMRKSFHRRRRERTKQSPATSQITRNCNQLVSHYRSRHW